MKPSRRPQTTPTRAAVLSAVLALGVLAGCNDAIGIAASAPPGAGAGAGGLPLPSAAAAKLPTSSTTVQPQPARGSCHARGSGLFTEPDATCTPGTTNPAVTQAAIRSTVCRSGWTRTVRPPESVTQREKLGSLAAYGDGGPPSAFEYDHAIPLELGGAPNDPRNLWPEPGERNNPKDALENRLKTLVCAGALPLVRAQRLIAADWVSAYRRYVGPRPAG